MLGSGSRSTIPTVSHEPPRTRLLARFRAWAHDERVALVDDGGSLAFRDLHDAATRLAGALVARGLGGQRVALLAAADRNWLTGFWAILHAGSAVVPISPLHAAREQHALLSRSKAAALLLGEGFANAAPCPVPSLRFSAGSLADGAPLAVGREQERNTGDDERRTGLLLFTSGTTGEPKGVPLSHHNLFEGADVLVRAWELAPRDVVLHMLPLHHLHGICVALLAPLLAGACVRLLPRFDGERVLGELSRATVLMGVPTQHKRLVDMLAALPEPERLRAEASFATLRLLTSGSAKLDERLGRRLEALSGRYPLERYGMTEVGIVLSNSLHGARRPGSCGAPLPGVEIRVVDEHGAEVERGAAGELWIRAPSVFEGYDGLPEATREAFAQGFFRSGDTAVQDEQGYVRLLGRTSIDIIKSGGYKLSALEIEELLLEHPEVNEVAVVGVADESWGERVVAVVVPESAGLTLDALRPWLKQRTASYKIPKQLVVADELPRNAMGKVTKPALVRTLLTLPATATRLTLTETLPATESTS